MMSEEMDRVVEIFSNEERRWNYFMDNAKDYLTKRLPESRQLLDDEEELNKEILKLAEAKLKELKGGLDNGK
jgi:hypothetical protein